MQKIASLHASLQPENAAPYTLKLPGNMTREEYLQGLQWSYSKYPHRRQLGELVKSVTGSVSAVDEELKVRKLNGL